MRPVVLLFVAVSLCWSSSHGLHIDKSTGAYEDIVVAIHPSVEPDERIIDNIKALFRSASTFLHRATRGLVHFGSVTIAVPDTWPARPQAKSTTASLFSVADVRVAARNPQYGDTPYTLQPRGCGERGEYVHLTPRFLGELNDSIAEVYGSPAYLLVHEWAHFRYGVFDEYGDPESFRYPSLYCEFGMVRASACSSRIKFTASTETGEPCRIYKGCRVSTKCKAHFEQSRENPVTSSIMFMPYLKGVTDFCESANKTHNIFAPNKHNHLCERKSTWEVISANEDFKQLAPTTPDRTFEVKFTEVQKRERALGRVIFALDVSGSMKTSDRIGYLKAAASQFIQALIPDGMEVGIVRVQRDRLGDVSADLLWQSLRERSSSRKQEYCFGLVDGNSTYRTNRADKQDLRKAPTRMPSVVVCVVVFHNSSLSAPFVQCVEAFERLPAPFQMFEENDQSAAGSVIILMTDGAENRDPKISDVVGKLVAAQVVVNTIAFGTEAERKLEDLALRTGGKPFAVRDGQTNLAIALESAFLDSAFTLLDDTKRPVVIFEQAATVVDKRQFSILVDADLGNETTITVHCKGAATTFTAELHYPGGKTCDDCQSTVPAGTDYKTFKIPGVATPGAWTLVVSCNLGACDVHVRATSLARDPDQEPVLARAFLKRTEVTSAAEAAIYAEVTKGVHVVLYAKVTATVVQPRGQIEMELFDNGLGADVTANDGIYSAYFTQFEGTGRYSVSARVIGGNDSVIVKGRQASGALPASQPSAPPTGGAPQPADADVSGIPLGDFVFVDEDIEQAEPRVLLSEKAPEFVRYAEGGSFRLANEIDQASLPPGSIQDLKVEDTFVDDNGTHVVVLSWTCPGGHMDSGNASRVELKGSTSLTELVRDFDSALEVRDEMAGGGNVTSGAVGSRQRLRFFVPNELLSVARNQSLRDFYFAAKVWNDKGLHSSLSNVAAVTFERPPPLEATSAKGTPWWIIVVSVLATVLVVGMVAAVAVKIVDRRNKIRGITFVVT
ncbi:calcium-activated chloride channel regulator 1 [Dermacentor silvarum]|uniref:calcium-activated chloride channel regulator 1 n=1 Tax=Dermacentor silvarum TaxID=543639 RepID=UPI0021019401|nr:calcium-activated chloride channel regulator 1 [Dermacentor silvarum]